MTTARRRLSKFLIFLILLAALLFATGVLRAQIETRSGEVIKATEAFPDMTFFAAGDLTVNAKSTDDIFAAGGDVALIETQADHMIVAGGDIIITDVAFHDLIVAGGDVNFVSGTVTDDVVGAGGDLNLSPDFKISGSAVLTGGDVTIDTPIGAELRAAAGRLRLNADVQGDAHLVGEEVTIGPNVSIGGDLRHRAQKFSMDPSAVVAGEIIELEPATPPDIERWGVKAASAIAVFAIAFLVGMAILIVVIALTLPGLMNSSSNMIRSKPLTTLGIGFLVTAAAPVAIALLLATVLGIPLAMLIGVIYLAAAPLAVAAFIYYVGMLARRMFSSGATDNPDAFTRILWTALASTLLLLLGLVPIAGGFFWLIAYMIGMGAVMTRGGKALALQA
ncbi:MAG: hypothetical protein AAGB02_04720 [Pseudomonadota bacterium]